MIMKHQAAQHGEFGPICAEKGICVSMYVWICLYVQTCFGEEIQEVINSDYLWVWEALMLYLFMVCLKFFITNILYFI